tara:strand:- start:187 stop:480 length:294 start_codon:yes stop_codon:yes gene_type:complete
MSKDINKKFGGAFWDTLFIFVKDNDEEFIFNFVNRLPCKLCINNFYHKLKRTKFSFDCSKEEILRKLWTMRCMIDEKYKNDDNEEKFNSYLVYLLLK